MVVRTQTETASAGIISDFGSPDSVWMPNTFCSSLGPLIMNARLFLSCSAVFRPMCTLNLRRTIVTMSSSSENPPSFSVRPMMTRPSEITEISVVSAPMLTIMCPPGSRTGRPIETASAIPLSTRWTRPGFREDLQTL